MRHGNKINHLGRTHAHREAMLSNMATSLILHKRINTTLAKAKELRKFVEPLITKSKTDSTHSRRMVFKHLQNKEAVTILFRDVAEKVAERPGGYTRILKTGNRLGDNAEMCFIELVDYNENMLKDTQPKKTKTRRRGGKKAKSGEATEAAAPKAEATTKKATAKKQAENNAEENKPAEPKENKSDNNSENKEENKGE